MTPDTAMAEIERAIGILAGVRAWLHRHETRMTELSPSEAHRLAGAQWCGWAAGDALTATHNAIGRLPLDTFRKDI